MVRSPPFLKTMALSGSMATSKRLPPLFRRARLKWTRSWSMVCRPLMLMVSLGCGFLDVLEYFFDFCARDFGEFLVMHGDDCAVDALEREPFDGSRERTDAELDALFNRLARVVFLLQNFFDFRVAFADDCGVVLEKDAGRVGFVQARAVVVNA